MTRRFLLTIATHVTALLIGVGLGIYLLPILIAPDAPAASDVAQVAGQARHTGTFRRDLRDSDPLHWGEGTVRVGPRHVALQGRLSPGPDYKLYLSPEFVETEADFLRLKASMRRVGDVKTFDNFLVELPPDVDVDRYRAVIVWCETFGEFITAAAYR